MKCPKMALWLQAFLSYMHIDERWIEQHKFGIALSYSFLYTKYLQCGVQRIEDLNLLTTHSESIQRLQVICVSVGHCSGTFSTSRVYLAHFFFWETGML
jgi:hypothetical protein